jgi:hypothetical protein
VCDLGVEAPAILRAATVIQVERLLKVPTHAGEEHCLWS